MLRLHARYWLALVLLIGTTASPDLAFADDEEEEEEEEEGDGGDSEEEVDEDDDSQDKDQPVLTAGGLFTMKTYPVRELFRPLTMTQKITQLRLGLGSDVSDKTAFQFFGFSLDGKYGYADNFTILGTVSSDYNFKGFNITGGFEAALAYDLFDIRLQAGINRSAQIDGTDVSGGTVVPIDYKAGAGIQFAVDLGFPFRYVARPEIAIVALETLISFDFNSITRGDGGENGMDKFVSCYAIPDEDGMVDPANCTEDGIKPDLAPSLGISTNPVSALSVVLFAQLQIRDFDTTNQFTIPATARVQFTPNQKLDIGLEFKFIDLKPKDPDGEGELEAPKFFAQRFLNLYVQARY
jgi:hypothetical protein